MDSSRNAPVIGFAVPNNWRTVRHPDFQLIDEIRISIKERWKDSEISGSEYRFSTVAECLHKGVVIASRGFGSDMNWAVMGVGALALSASDNGIPENVLAMEEIVCAQPACCAAATVFYRVKALYTNMGAKEELPRPHDKDGTVHVIRFCTKHRYRGDCGLQDADANYQELPHPMLAAMAKDPQT